MHKEWEPCFVLHTRPFSDTSLIADIFSLNHGRMSVLAKGAKKPKSKYFGHLMPFRHIRLTFSGKSDLKTLNEIDSSLIDHGNSNQLSTYSYLYINELLLKILPQHIPNKELFNLYQAFVDSFTASTFKEESLRCFELDLLDVLGFGINFDTDSLNNSNLENDQKYQFVPESGFRASNDNGNFTKAELVKVKDRELTEIDKHKLKTLTQAAIAACLDGKDLNSRSTFKRLS